MHKTLNELYSLIKDLKSEKEFKKEIQDRKKKYDELLDEDTIALLIVDELGRNEQSMSSISSLKPGIDATIFGKITGIKEQRSFNRKNGSNGRVVNLEITDETGSCGLALWDNDVELVNDETITIGSNVKIINGYVKDGYTGMELNVGRWSLLEVEPDNMPTIKEEIEENTNNIEGEILDIEPTTPFFKDNGDYGFVTKIRVKDERKGMLVLSVWDEKVKEIQKFKKQDHIIIKNIDIRERNGENEYHVNGKSTIKT